MLWLVFAVQICFLYSGHWFINLYCNWIVAVLSVHYFGMCLLGVQFAHSVDLLLELAMFLWGTLETHCKLLRYNANSDITQSRLWMGMRFITYSWDLFKVLAIIWNMTQETRGDMLCYDAGSEITWLRMWIQNLIHQLKITGLFIIRASYRWFLIWLP